MDFVHDLAPGDLDGDGRWDFYLGVTRDPDDQSFPFYDALYRQQPSGELAVDQSTISEDIGVRHTFDALWVDEDGDGDLDVYLANDLGAVLGASTLLRNEDGQLVDAAAECSCSILSNAKGVDVDDFNRDGLADFYISGNPRNTLLMQLEDGSFVDVTVQTHAQGVTEPATGWGAVFLDFDNDGARDILSGQGDRWNEGNEFPHFNVPFQLLHQKNGFFEDVAPEYGMTLESSFRAVLAADMNEDGIEDLLVTTIDQPPLLYLSTGCTENNWVEIEGPVGSKVEVRAGDLVQTGWIHSDSGYLSYRTPRLHFGLGDHSCLTGLTVVLPGGERIEVNQEINARRRIVIQP